MRFGVNYVPSRNWFYSWQHLDLTHVDEDFCAIRELGFDHIRMHLRWDLFQPNAAVVPEYMLGHLRDMLDLAEKYHLQVQVSVFVGWMSGFWFMPSFIKGRHILTDPAIVEAEYFLLEKIAGAVEDKPAFMGIDIGNELNVYEMFYHAFSVEQGDRWLSGILGECERLMPGKMHVIGVDHQPWFGDVQFSRHTLANTGGATSLHTWIAFTGALQYGFYSEENLSLQEFNIELANAYAEQAGRPVWIQEYGITDAWADPADFEVFVRSSMMAAARSENLWGFTWWCSHDLSPVYRDFDPIEYNLGLLTVENRVKPLGEYVRNCIRDMKQGITAPPLQTGPAIVIDDSEPFHGWTYGEAYADALREGIHAKFVLASRAADSAYLRRRGITECINVK